MLQTWTFGQRLAAGLAVIVALTLLVGVVALRALDAVVESKDRLLTHELRLLQDAQRLDSAAERKVAAFRGFLLVRDPAHLERAREARRELLGLLERLEAGTPDAEGRRLLAAVAGGEAAHQEAAERVISLRDQGRGLEEVAGAFEAESTTRRAQLAADLDAYVGRLEAQVEEARASSNAAAEAASRTTQLMLATVVLVAAGIAFLLTRTLSSRIAGAVASIESSSAELQSAASQQATGAKEQATSMSEITTTIGELVATARQIAESAGRVARIAGQTAEAAGAGGDTVQKAQDSVSGIRRQVEVVVGHMLELGKRSQQTGAVIDIVTELAEQTNILAINATIEAAGAGEAGKRFAVVADEIRKLADRVAASAKEIRSMVEDVRGAVNATVMATETSSKAAEAGTRQFAEVAARFGKIAELVSTTTEAARQIELSTQQQTTAVEQVNIAIANAAQASRETEASSSQTLQTSGTLAGLSRDLLRLVKRDAAA
jgi:methyl-accepting chemotaxis protein